jgi:ketosteroid isomerase-like protein
MKQTKMIFDSAAAVEAAFYSAFGHCDLAAMQGLWAHVDSVCIHPGAEAVKGYDAIVRSWDHIFRGAERPNVQTKVIQIVVGDDLAVHVVEEHIGSSANPSQGAVVLATNVYRRDDEGWLMVAHNASLVRVQQMQSHTLQ